MTEPGAGICQDARLAELCSLEDEDSRKQYLSRHPDLASAEQVELLTDSARRLLRVDLAQALRAGEAALAMAEALNDKQCLGRALRAKANALWFTGRCAPAAELLVQAATLFEDAGRMDEVGRTLSTSIQPLILLGEYDQALRNVERAREIFQAQGDDLRLARLELNAGNIEHRQERFAEALAAYETAYQRLLPYRDLEGIAVALHNMAVCLIGLEDLERAFDVYREARGFFQANDMPRLVFQVDYNLAYLYYLRGDYQIANTKLRATRESCSADDPYHAALCDLDQSEVYLELNLSEEAVRFAQRAAEQFEKMGMGYELARSWNNLGIGLGQKRDTQHAMEAFNRAKRVFEKEGHQAGKSLVELYRAILLVESGDLHGGRQSAVEANGFFRASGMHRKAALCDLLLCQVSLSEQRPDLARESCDAAFLALAELHAPVLNYQAQVLSGRIHEAMGQLERGAESYHRAVNELESLRTSLQGEELRISFMTGKLEVYQRLIRLALLHGSNGQPAEEAFLYMERAKSRSLVESLFGRANPVLPSHSQEGSSVAIGNLRGQLNWVYHRIDSEQLQEPVSSDRIERLWTRARDRENELLRALRESPGIGAEADAGESNVLTLSDIRAALDATSALIEYFQIGDQLVAAILTVRSLEIVSLAPAARVRNHLRMLQFQLSKFRLGPEYSTGFEAPLMAATERRLRELYEDLVYPLEKHIGCDHLIFAPHSFLHYLPLHALHDGKNYLIDRFTISYVPSASVYALTRRRRLGPGTRSLILGIPDSRAPWILSEVGEVAAVLPDSSLFLGAEASRETLEKCGAASRVIHVATHGVFRSDNPMFSAVRLGDSYLSLYDLYTLRLPAELLALSGCNTGLNVIAAGDEVMGLARGLLYAGAHTLLLTLWDVHDRSTSEFMRSFYGHWNAGQTKPAALRHAMLELRQRFPHPYFWAPFLLVGRAP